MIYDVVESIVKCLRGNGELDYSYSDVEYAVKYVPGLTQIILR